MPGSWSDIGLSGQGSATSKTAGTTVSVTPSNAADAGYLLVVFVVGDNIATASGASSNLSLSGMGSWTKVGEWTRSSGAAGDGVVVAMWYQFFTSLTTGAAITCTFSSSVTAKAILVVRAAAGWNAASTVTATMAGASGSSGVPAVTHNPGATRDKWIGLLGAEGPTGDTTNADVAFTDTGAWDVGTSGGSATTNARMHVDGLTSSATTMTWAPDMTSRDWSMFLAGFAITEPSGTTYPQALSGGLSFSGGFTKRGGKAVVGGLTFSGSFSKAGRKTLPAGLTFSGALTKLTARALGGGLTFSGVLASSRVFLKALTGGLSFSGGFSKRVNRSLAGGLSFSGAVSKRVGRSLAGGLSFGGGLTKRTSRSVAGVLSFSGGLARETRKVLAGALSFVGSLGTALTSGGTMFTQALTGGLSFSGAMTRRTNRSLTGGLSFAGSVAKRTSRAFSGGLSFVGTRAISTSKVFAGSVSFSGTMSKSISRALSSSLAFAGSLARSYIPFVGTTYFKALTGSLSFSGGLSVGHLRAVAWDVFARPYRNVVRYGWYRGGLRKRG